MKKIVSVLLILCMLLSLAACKQEEPVQNPSNNSQNTATEDDYLASLPDYNNKGSEFRILVTQQLVGFYDQENVSADIVENACYERNLAVEDRFEIDIVYNNLDGNSSGAAQFSAEIVNNLQAQENDA